MMGHSQRSFRSRSTHAVVIVLAATAPVAVVWAGAVTTAPSTARTTDEIAERIRRELIATGGVEALAAELRADTSDRPEVLDFRARVALERADLTAATAALTQLAAARPGDATVLRRLAYVDELTGNVLQAESSLRAALRIEKDISVRSEIRLRLSAILFNDGRVVDATAALSEAVAEDAGVASRAGVMAYLSGEYGLASNYLTRGDSGVALLKLLAGNAALHAGDTANATNAFASFQHAAQQPDDKRYAQERLIAAARQSGTLPALAESWLADESVPTERLFPLATVLRETGRVRELIRWWGKLADNPLYDRQVLSSRFVSEVLGAAQSAGLASDAEGVAKHVLAQRPGSLQSLAATARTCLANGNADGADALFTQRINAAGATPATVETLGKLALSLGRDGPALAAATKLVASGGNGVITGRLLEANIQRLADRADLADAALGQAAAEVFAHPETVADVAAALEAAGRPGEAADLLRALIERQTTAGKPPGDSVLEQLGSMLTQQARPRDAAAVYRTLLHAAKTPAGRSQAAQRLVESAAAAGTLDEVATETQHRLASGTGDTDDLSLLVSIYVKQKRFNQAVEVLQLTPLLDRATKLRRLVTLYRRVRFLDDASDALTELVTADPANAVTTLEELAAVELDRRDRESATEAIDEIARRLGNAPGSGDLMAAVYDRLNRPEDAARIYRRALAADPDKAEVWLLWAVASAKAGHSAEAIRRLQVLCGEAANDNVFALAVDGLLNLNAPKAALHAARRDALLRAAARPTQAILLGVIADLSDELKDSAATLRVTDAAVALNREERPQKIRELMELAGTSGDVELAAECGRSLLALGDEFPPQLFLTLGEQLLASRRQADAVRALARAQEASPEPAVARQVADVFERNALPGLALATLLPVQDRGRSDPVFRENLGRLFETTGRPEKAFEAYLAALRVRLAELNTGPRRGIEKRGAQVVATGAEMAASAEAIARVTEAALAVIRTPEQRTILIGELENAARSFLKEVAVDGRPPAVVIAITNAFRTAALLSGDATRADRLDDEMIAHFPSASAFKRSAYAARRELGLATRAAAFAERYGTGDIARPTSVPTSINAEQAAARLPGMIAGGDIATAAELLMRLPVGPSALSSLRSGDIIGAPKDQQIAGSEVPATLVAASHAVGDDGLAAQWAVAWYQAVRAAAPAERGRNAGGPAVDWAAGVVDASWPLLSREGRTLLLKTVLEDAAPNGRVERCLLVLRLSADAPDIDVPAVIDRLLQSGASLDGRAVAKAFAVLPDAERAGFVRRAIATVAARQRLDTLLRLVAGSIDSPFDDATNAAILTALTDLPERQSVAWGDWCLRSVHKSLLPALAEVVLNRGVMDDEPRGRAVANDDGTLEAAVAIAFLHAGDKARADELGLRVLAKILAAGRPSANAVSGPNVGARPSRVALGRIAVGVLSEQSRQRLLQQLDTPPAAASAEPKSSSAKLLELTLRSAVGERGRTLEALRSMYANDPTDPAVRVAFGERLIADGRYAEFVTAIGARLRPGTEQPGPGDPLRPYVLPAYRELFRLREVRTESGPGRGPGMLIADFATPSASGKSAEVIEVLRSTIARLRETRYATVVTSDDNTIAKTTLDRITQSPGAADEIYCAVHGLTARALRFGANYGWLTATLPGIADVPDAREPILKKLEASAASGTLTVGDRFMLTEFGRAKGVRLSTPLLNALCAEIFTTGTADEYVRLARVLRTQGDSRADAVERWAYARSAVREPTEFVRRPSPEMLVGQPLSPNADDMAIADWIEKRRATDPARAEADLAALRRMGRVSADDVKCGLLWARLAAERGDADAFKTRLATLIDTLAWKKRTRVMARSNEFALNDRSRDDVDLRDALPASVNPDTFDKTIRDAVAAVMTATERFPDDVDLPHHLAVLGCTAAEHGAFATAEDVALKITAMSVKQGTGTHWLAIADLATRLNDQARGTAIEIKLLDERCLPAARIVTLLTRLIAGGDIAMAERYAKEASRYCYDPRIQTLIK